MGSWFSSSASGDSDGNSTSQVFLNVYDLTPLNNYTYWFGFGIFHSGIEGEIFSHQKKEKNKLYVYFFCSHFMNFWIWVGLDLFFGSGFVGVCCLNGLFWVKGGLFFSFSFFFLVPSILIPALLVA